MPAVEPGSKVLVSGANGFIAVWVVRLFLEAGYTVRGTVRSESKAGYLRTMFENYGQKFEVVVVEDITKPGAFDTAVKGMDAIAHTASPFHFEADDPNGVHPKNSVILLPTDRCHILIEELIEPAVHGTVGILESTLKNAPDVKRVVVLSSCASVSNPSDFGILNESNWNLENIEEVKNLGKKASQPAKYRASKTLAERAAWDFVAKNKGEIKWDLVTLCPPFVFGPVLHDVSSPAALNTSVKDVYESLLGGTKTPEQLQNFQGSWVDVRDVALAHVRALERPEAAGKRFIISSSNFVWQDWFDAANTLSIPGVNVPKGEPGAGAKVTHRHVYDTTRAKEELGIKFIDMKTTAKDMIDDFKKRGW
ncbi:NAD-binding protein [Rickenella mellea]|uniref:NAD-binding protein n=1 Tax=Rickenella mellea TaxID=50990 RepID=A0A4Y7PN87_9AGAM|nr:NAD-binding protein [Rickenella mellea]